MLCNKLSYRFCITHIAELRSNFKHKICYKKKYNFLNLKHTPSYALSTRLIKRGNVIKIYKILNNFFYNELLRKKFSKISLLSNFLFFYNKYYSFRDINRVLYWKYSQLNCMFSHKAKFFKKKKQYSTKLIFVTNQKRLLLAINFLKCLILLNVKRRKKNLTTNLFNPLFNYITVDKNNLVEKVKYRIYRQKLMQLQE